MQKKPEKINENVLDYQAKMDRGQGGIWNSIKYVAETSESYMSNILLMSACLHRSWINPEENAVARKHADINIFSVASGHLYERFLSIMVLSVLQHTESTVKFWFIENFLSPAFKVRLNWYWV